MSIYPSIIQNDRIVRDSEQWRPHHEINIQFIINMLDEKKEIAFYKKYIPSKVGFYAQYEKHPKSGDKILCYRIGRKFERFLLDRYGNKGSVIWNYDESREVLTFQHI